MLCDKCKTKEATFHYKVTSGGKTTETHLCSECAKEKGISSESVFGGKNTMLDGLFSDDKVFGDFFGGLLGKSVSSSGGRKSVSGAVCPVCGMTGAELSKLGKLGCAECYKTFERILTPTVSKIHGNVAHTGKAPEGFAEARSKLEEIRELKDKLASAIEAQEYEEAARLRDMIRDLEAKENTKGGEDK